MTNVLGHFASDQQNETKERTDQLVIVFGKAFKEFENHIQKEISRCKGKDDTYFTKLRIKIKQRKSETDKSKKEAYEKDCIIKDLTDTDVSIGETRWPVEFSKSKCFSNQTNKPLKTVNSFFTLREKKI